MTLLLPESTKIVIWNVDARPWHVHGLGAGREGVTLIGQTGHMFAPVSLLVSEGARQDGATFLRSVRHKKEMDLLVFIRGRTVRDFQAIHDAWFRGWSTDRPCTIGTFTHHQGWRYQQVQLDSAPEPQGDVDPAKNAAITFQMSVTAMDPLTRHFDETVTWTNTLGLNEGVLRMRNAADQVAWPRYTMPGPGRYWIQDPTDSDGLRIVQTPILLAGETLRIDSHPRHRTARVYSAAHPSGRNVWGQLAGRRWLASLPPWSSTDIVVRVSDGGTTESAVTGTVSPRSSRPY
ncbi:phage tail protein [Nocardia sp. CY41]|uniref:phage tail protein n=1 Tax=Nocardia sp. CY41 TaxID=2608686 RepID=UPI00191656D1|nr:phage tail protein [Nocardia sp. CY41]